jgi:hypothetical protein
MSRRKAWSGKVHRSPSPFYRPRVEFLEDRTLLSFTAAPTYPAGSGPYAVAVGDFNGDGAPDLVVTNPSSRAVNVLLGRGDGSFQAPVSYAIGYYGTSVAVGDFNGDGILDLVVANRLSNTVSVLLGRGDGTF